MNAIILAGGLGTRISEESAIRSKPILWHIMKVYSHHGIDDFVIRLCYKVHLIKEYFTNCFPVRQNVRFALKTNNVKLLINHVGPWIVTPTT
jgi:glucose-1-phosphate cytidylyltransferase